jgi:hypothetical protein
MMPLALGWDDLDSYMHSYAPGWVIAEILVIAAVALIYSRGHRADWQGGWLRARTVAEPALAAALHGAIAQSEAYRLEAASERMVVELGKAAENLRATTGELRQSIRDAVSVLLQEHQDWHMLVRPHHLPLG